MLEEKGTTCCYANSDKQWIADPQGIAWETFLSHGRSTVYGRQEAAEHLSAMSSGDAPCCGPSAAECANLVKATTSCGCGTEAS